MSSLTEVRVPDIGDFDDVPVIEIHVAAGDEVAPEDPLVTLESDKATMDVPAPSAGVVKQLQVKIGDRVSEGSVLLSLETEEATGSDGAGPSGESTEAPETPEDPEATETPEATEATETSEATETPTAPTPPGAATAPRSDAPESGPPPSPPEKSDHDAQVVVIGSGPGGYTAAFRAADLGLKTVLIERYETLGGVCLNVGCIPSKALLHAARVIAEAEEMADYGVRFGQPQVDVSTLIEWKQSVVDKLTGGLRGLARRRKVEVVHGVARFTGPNAIAVGDRTITFDNCIIAAGAEAAMLPDLPEDPRIIDSTRALSPSEIPGRLLVVGAGIIGLEMATVYDALGARVTVVELLDQLIPGCDRDLVAPLQDRIAKRYEGIHFGTEVTSIEPKPDGLEVKLSTGASEQFDAVLVAIGRRPNGRAIEAEKAGVEVDERGFIAVDRQLRTNVRGIYAIGDIVGGPMLAHKATHEGKTAAEVIAGVPGAEFDVKAIPSVAYTDPEVAWMGLTENEAQSSEIAYEKAVFPWAASGRALGLGRSEGLTKLLFEPDTRLLLGAGIVGVNAGDLIAETVHALEMGAEAEDIALTVHPHPTLSETVAFAAEMAAGTITDLMPPRSAAKR